jgi:UDP-N-acetylglucosamine diphosphorylase / glucose-1-phosphate thymidylyltransferase / UDP-N-acetylgalactosamine diphosphorylase / glucosamine-1-phosphate N-acetyltransferase / galactosamine-1-phosphate N-acetyltransferase
MYLCLFEDDQVPHLNPLTLTRPAYDLRLGLRTLLEKVFESFDDPSLLLHTRPFLAAVTGREHDALVNHIPEGLDVLFINGRYVAEDGELLDRLRRAGKDGEPGRVYMQGGEVVAAYVPGAQKQIVSKEAVTRASFGDLPEEEVEGALMIRRLWDLVEMTPAAITSDFNTRSKGYKFHERPNTQIHDSAILVESERIFTAPGAIIQPGAVLNAENGPIYIDRDASIMEGAIVRGPTSIGAKSTVKVHADINSCAVGPVCKISGEVHTTTLHSFTNKAHAGFLGHSYLGRWVNIGAGTISSNLRNDYGTVSIYDSKERQYVDTGTQFVGLIMADHAKSGINTMFNTGTVIGVSCNVFGSGFPARYLPSFSWGEAARGFTEYRLDKALEVSEAMMQRRGVPLTEEDRILLETVFEMTAAEREAIHA